MYQVIFFILIHLIKNILEYVNHVTITSFNHFKTDTIPIVFLQNQKLRSRLEEGQEVKVI